MVGPISDQRPLSRLETEVIEAIGTCREHGETVVLVAAAKKGGAQSTAFIHHAVGELKPNNVSIKIEQAHRVDASKNQMLQSRGPCADRVARTFNRRDCCIRYAEK